MQEEEQSAGLRSFGDFKNVVSVNEDFGPTGVGLRRAVLTAWIVTQSDTGTVPEYLWHVRAN